jgi:hypothetical protein
VLRAMAMGSFIGEVQPLPDSRTLPKNASLSKPTIGTPQDMTSGYAAGTWSTRRRVVIKAEVVRHQGREPKNNPRFVVASLAHSLRHLYEAIYCARGDVESLINELHHGVEIGRSSCSRFLANQLRGLLGTAAYVLYKDLRLRATRTACRSA